MMVNAKPNTCLSTQPHDDRVLDVSLHYFGCLKVKDQTQYFAGLPSKSQRRIQKVEYRIAQLRALYQSRTTSYHGKLLKSFKEKLYEWHSFDPRHSPLLGSPWPLRSGPEESPEEDLNASVLYFKDSRPYDMPGIDNQFPHQKISVQELLSDSHSNPIMKRCPENMIRYFHLPANNMVWIEVSTRLFLS